MGYCSKCGKDVNDGDTFCSYCGSKIETFKNVQVCTLCGAELKNGQLFCSSCGTAVCQGGHPTQPVTARTLTVSRKTQFVCCAVGYKVCVDGVELGNIGVGKSVSTNISSDTVRVEIKCTTVLMTGIRLWMMLKVTQNAVIEFELQYGGAISARITGAEILDQGH